MLDPVSAVQLSLLPGALGAFLLRVHHEARSGSSGSSDALSVEALLHRVLPAPRAAALLAHVRRAAAPLVADLAARRRHALIHGAPGFPDLLAATPDPPPCLWIAGHPGALACRAVALVGSRAASPSSLEVAHGLASDLAAAGLVIVSGLARGVDAAAHRGALEGGGTTVAVLGSGLDRIYPPEHRELAHRIVEGGGTLASELPPSAPPRKDHFPRRNRIISGLSLGVVVVEASHRSGSLITARLALEQGREVLAVPGCVLGERHRGAHALLRDGAALVESAGDVLDALGLAPHQAACRRTGEPAPAEPLLAVLPPGEPMDLQELVEASGLEPSEILRRLTTLELAGAVRRQPGGRFLRPSAAVVR
jgi:DNA processing protein